MDRDEYIKKFYEEVKENVEGDYKIILEPGRKLKEDWIEYDQVKWEVEENIEELVKELQKDDTLSFEEKILKVYEKICLNYIYDDNVLYFFKRDASDINNIKYIAVDWYGRIVGNTWIENRKKHNRRICYEFARIYVKAINELLGENKKLEAFMVGDKENLHYVVGLTGDDYSAILDLDNFNKIKDLTRLKLGLTLDGITILRGETGKLKDAIDNYNKGRLVDLLEMEEAKNKFAENDVIKYLNEVVKILKSYNIDSQGFMEYTRAKVENQGIEIEKIWKEIKGGAEKRYVRCILFDFDGKTYLIDTVEQEMKVVNREDLKEFVFNPQEHQYPYYGG